MKFICFLFLIFAAGLYADDGIVINAVGDTMIGTLYPCRILPPEDGKSSFQFVEGYLTNGNPDIVLANLEGAATYYTKTYKDEKRGRTFAFRMPPEYLKYLNQAHISVVNQANNHAMDFGERGFLDTRKFLDSYGIKYTGLKNEVLSLNIRGRKIAVIGFAWFDFANNILKEDEFIPFIREVSLTSDIVIVEVHGGAEGVNYTHVSDRMEYLGPEQRGDMVRFSHLAIDNGASIVLGSGPHVPRAMEIYKNKLIAYSLGNFVTYGMFSMDGYMKYSLILNACLDSKGDFVRGRITPLVLCSDGPYRGIPYYDTGKTVIKIISELSKTDIANNALFISDDGTLSVM